MISSISDIAPLFAGVFVLSVLVSTGIALYFVRAIKRGYDEDIRKVRNKLDVAISGSIGMGKKLIVLEKKINALSVTQEEMRVSDMDFSYSQAQRLIEQGADLGTIAANSGLSSSEIQLMQLIHSQQNAFRVEPRQVEYN